MKAEILSIGDELLIGQVVNTNSSRIAEMLNAHGFSVSWISTISDTAGAIREALDIASDRADVVISTGGLGPTSDDRTRDVLVDYFGGELVFHQQQYEHVEAFFKKRNMPMLESNRQQAMVPDAATLLANEIGTAAGMLFKRNGTLYFFLPGVPFEMLRLMETSVIPELKKVFKASIRKQKTILTFGMGESFLAEKIKDIEENLPPHIKLAYLPSPQRVRLRLTAEGGSGELVQNELQYYVDKIEARIPELVFGEDNQRMEEVVGSLLQEKSARLATAESCTGGTIAQLITSVPGSSACFQGAVVAYSNEIKQNILNVKSDSLVAYGAVSEAVVREMAEGVKKKFQVDYALATSGIAGPEGGTEEKPVGTVWFALAGPHGTITKKMVFGKDRHRNILRSSYFALNMLRLELLSEKQ